MGAGTGRPPVVGRLLERGLLAAALDRACDGAGGVVLLAGEAGIGKTTLLDELAGAAHAAGARVVRGHGWEGAGAPALVVWDEVLRTLGAAVAPLHPGAVLAALTDAARAGPVLVALEDLHAADADSARVVAHLSARLSSLPVLVVASYRPEDLARTPGLAEALASVAARCTTLQVPPLDEQASSELAAALAGHVPAPDVLGALVARSDGNPFFLRELLHAAGDAGRVPAGVAAAVRHRTARLPTGTQELLSLAACAGREIDVRLLAAAHGARPDAVLEALGPALGAGALARGQDGALRFRHALVAEAVVGDLAPVERARRSLALAAALQALPASPASSVAHQLVAAGALAEPDDVVAWCERAGVEAEGAGAPLEAVRHWERALVLLPPGVRRGRLRERTGHALFSSGTDNDAAVAAFEQALEDYERSGDDRRAAVVHSRLGALLALYRSASDLHRAEQHFAAAAEVLRAPVDRARLLVGTSTLRLLRGEVVEGLAEAEEAERVAAEAGHPALAATGTLMRGAHLQHLGRLRESFAALDAAFSTARDRPLVDVQAAWHGITAGVLLEDRALAESYASRARRAVRGLHLPGQEQIVSDNLAPALAMSGDLAAAARELAGEDLLGFALQREGLVPLYAGDWNAARTRLAELLDADELAGQRLRVSIGAWALGWLHRLRGELDDARRVLHRPLTDLVTQRRALDELPVRAELALVEVAAGDRAAACEHLARADALRPDHPLRGLGVRLDLARAALDGRGFTPLVAAADALRLPWLALDVLARQAEAEPERAAGLRAQIGERLRALGAEDTGWAALGAAPVPEFDEVVLGREGEGWRLTSAVGSCRLEDSKGVRHLARLVQHPQREWHALDLVQLAEGGRAPWSGAGVPDPLIDPQARAAYRRRLAELGEEADDAAHLGDTERAARARAEREALVDHLASATGLRGRDRGHSTAAERARQSVTKTLRATVVRVGRHDARLASHLQSALRTGLLTSYRPDPASTVRWRVEDGR